ncbi:MAG: DinB family protein [Actinomycetota bacterium]|nr:DinB family protein [Actinomycetota bacterium]
MRARRRLVGADSVWLPPKEDPRGEGTGSDERSTLTDYLRHYRTTLELKCTGLDAEQLARRSVPPSTLSLLGLLRHLAGVEQVWFRTRLAGQVGPRHFRDAGPDGEFDGAVADDAVVGQAWGLWREEVAFAEAYVDAAPSMDHVGADGNVLRDVLVHMVEEYARHCGHADLLRECIDGRVGQ